MELDNERKARAVLEKHYSQLKLIKLVRNEKVYANIKEATVNTSAVPNFKFQYSDSYSNELKSGNKPKESKSFIQLSKGVLCAQDVNVVSKHKNTRKVFRSDRLKDEIIELSNEIVQLQIHLNQE
eukprot:TRINITY_DN9045_c0_g1_i2.p1 TRINITY_DN9045_c0_g1~~TRINITY_DN9045_c0_g1_i2.p1  ORF type:complete len:125 (-),score=13.13 TRINITY_DN9045_c0_g1_i2:42-416(-)